MDYDLDEEDQAAVRDARFDRQFAMAGKIIGLSLTGLVVLGFAGWIDHHFWPDQQAHAMSLR